MAQKVLYNRANGRGSSTAGASDLSYCPVVSLMAMN